LVFRLSTQKEIPHSATFEFAVERKSTQFKHEIQN